MNEEGQQRDWRGMKFGTEYLSPAYYDKILKKYSAKDDSGEDTDLLADFIARHPRTPSILELGCGSGRATKVIGKHATYETLVVTDLSKRMLEHVKGMQIPKISKYENTDHLTYLQETKEKFDLVISLWSLAHSVFPWYSRYGSAAFEKIESILIGFFTKNLNKNGGVFIIQTDGASEEQSLIKRSWFLGKGSGRDTFKVEYYENFQSPAIRILTHVFNKLIESGVFDKGETKITRIAGREIEYESVEEALEIFMNFHLEGEFNGTEQFDEVYAFLKAEFEKITATKGRLAIGTGFWVCQARKIS